jgi:hypothetical protein
MFLRQEKEDTTSDLIASFPHRIDFLTLWIRQRPIVSTESRYIRALVSATHRDQFFRIVGQLCS